jgi:aspartyl-tRNA(Asn)/glutamyl-tRNA(Gln) amidotransferase subunit A
MCGIVGLKPTYGRVSRRGVFPLSFSLDHIGPMTRTVADNAMLMSTIAGHDPQDPGSAGAETEDFGRDLGRGVKGLTIGIVRHFHTTDIEADPEMARAIDQAVDTFRHLGARVSDVKLAPLAEYAAINRAILTSEAYAIHEHWLKERPGDYGQLARRRLLPGAFIRAVDYQQAVRRKAQLVAQANEVLSRCDVLLAASSMDPACRIDDPAEIERTYPRQARTPFNVTGHPALALGAGFHSNGLPLSFQIVGRPFDEATIYRVAAAYEAAHEWHKRHPVKLM